MENGRSESGSVFAGDNEKEKEGTPSYTYWVRETTADAVPLPPPKKLSPHDLISSQPPTLGSVWNGAAEEQIVLIILPHHAGLIRPIIQRQGTWEEKNLNKWATERIKELLLSVGSLQFCGGKAYITEVSKCLGDAFLVTVRNKKCVNYTFELTIKIKGEWIINEESKVVNGRIDIPEFSFGEVDDLQMDVQLSDDKDLSEQDEVRVRQDLKLFLKPVREKLVQFEQELKER